MSDSKGRRFVFKDGKFVEGKATPWLPPQHMRGLPAAWTTKEEADGDKVHELDPPHIVKALVQEQAKVEQTQTKDLPAAVQRVSSSLAPLGENVPLSQERIDIVRFRIIRARVSRLAQSPQPEKDLAAIRVDYVFFPENNVNKYELRAKVARHGARALPHPLPKHLRAFRLEVDIYNWPESVVDALTALGYKPPNIREMINDAKRRSSIAQELQREESLVWTPGGDN